MAQLSIEELKVRMRAAREVRREQWSRDWPREVVEVVQDLASSAVLGVLAFVAGLLFACDLVSRAWGY